MSSAGTIVPFDKITASNLIFDKTLGLQADKIGAIEAPKSQPDTTFLLQMKCELLRM